MANTKFQILKNKIFLSSLDILALFAWGILLLKYWFTGELKLLIHPNYFGLVFITSIIFLILSGLKLWELFSELRKQNTISPPKETLQHITLFPPGWGSMLLVITALIGFLLTPRVLTSHIALQRGIADSLPLTQSQPQSFRSTIKPEDRTIIDWVRTLNAYPEPDAYTGQKAKVKGFVIDLPQLPDNYLFISRFVLTCCAVDAYPVGIPVKLSQSRNNYPPDTWLEVEGEMITETLPVNNQMTETTNTKKRQLVLLAKSLKPISTPADPYSY